MSENHPHPPPSATTSPTPGPEPASEPTAFSDRIAFEDLVRGIEELIADAGASTEVASVLARNYAGCERDGALSHGVFRVPGTIAAIRNGWADGAAEPVIEHSARGLIRVDAANGFAQPALAAASDAIADAVEQAGTAIVAIRESHHFSALWPDLEPFAKQGLVGMTMVTGAAAVIPRGAREKVLGTNPLAFATPVADQQPLIMDFATSSMSHGDLQLAARAGRTVPIGTGTGAGGRDTADPEEILNEGGLLPFGGHKGTALSIMVEVLASAFTGAAFSYREDIIKAPEPAKAPTDRTGQFLLFMDPERGQQHSFARHVAELIGKLRDSGVDRLPADRRYRFRSDAVERGIPRSAAISELLS